jgi:hypothetical protein
MNKNKLFSQELVWTSPGMLDAGMIRSLLDSYGIHAELLGESAGSTYGINFGPLGEVEIYVLKEQANKARKILDDYQNGELE